MDTKFGTNVSNRMLLNAAKCQRYSFYRFWINKGKPTGRVKTTPPTQINKEMPPLKQASVIYMLEFCWPYPTLPLKYALFGPN